MIVGVLAAACAGPTREAVLDPMIGQDVDVAIEAFGQPEETVDLGEGRHLYVWRRVYEYDSGLHSLPEFDRRRGDWLFDDAPLLVEARVCSTRLAVGFDFVIESWDYGCETDYVERRDWRRGRPVPALGGRPY